METPIQDTPPPRKGKFRKFAWITAMVLLVALLAYYFICGMTYEKGTLSGVLVKISKKGYVFKTYEGELNTVGTMQANGALLPGKTINFSVTESRVYYDLEHAQGQRVELRYRQVLKSFFWQGDTDYFVDQATIIK